MNSTTHAPSAPLFFSPLPRSTGGRTASGQPSSGRGRGPGYGTAEAEAQAPARIVRKALLAACVALLAGCGGPEGPQGPVGPAGPSGVALMSNLTCNSLLNGVLYSYDLARFSSGSAFVSCSVSDSYVQASWSTFYAATQQGAATGSCTVTLDIDPSNGRNFGWWSFVASGTTVRATYHDPGTTNDGKGLTLNCQ